MPVINLAKVFGPTIIGYSCPEPEPEAALRQLKKQHSVSARQEVASQKHAHFSRALDNGEVVADPRRLLESVC